MKDHQAIFSILFTTFLDKGSSWFCRDNSGALQSICYVFMSEAEQKPSWLLDALTAKDYNIVPLVQDMFKEYKGLHSLASQQVRKFSLRSMGPVDLLGCIGLVRTYVSSLDGDYDENMKMALAYICFIRNKCNEDKFNFLSVDSSSRDDASYQPVPHFIDRFVCLAKIIYTIHTKTKVLLDLSTLLTPALEILNGYDRRTPGGLPTSVLDRILRRCGTAAEYSSGTQQDASRHWLGMIEGALKEKAPQNSLMYRGGYTAT